MSALDISVLNIDLCRCVRAAGVCERKERTRAGIVGGGKDGGRRERWRRRREEVRDICGGRDLIWLEVRLRIRSG